MGYSYTIEYCSSIKENKNHKQMDGARNNHFERNNADSGEKTSHVYAHL